MWNPPPSLTRPFEQGLALHASISVDKDAQGCIIRLTTQKDKIAGLGLMRQPHGEEDMFLPLLRPVFLSMKGRHDPLISRVMRTNPAVHSTISDLITYRDSTSHPWVGVLDLIRPRCVNNHTVSALQQFLNEHYERRWAPRDAPKSV